MLAETVLVEAAAFFRELLVQAKDGCEIARLREETGSAAVDLGPWHERLRQDAFEVVHRAAMTADPVVQLEGCEDQAGANGKRRRQARRECVPSYPIPIGSCSNSRRWNA